MLFPEKPQPRESDRGFLFKIVTIPFLVFPVWGVPREVVLSAMDDGLCVEARDDAIHVAQPGTSLAVTFHRNNGSCMLEAWDFSRSQWVSSEAVHFMAAASKLAYSEAKARGWLRAMPVRSV
jgi:hypothetical protein